MKYILHSLLVVTLLVTACKKGNNNNNTTPGTTTTVYPNRVIITDNGNSYTLEGYSSKNPNASAGPAIIDGHVDHDLATELKTGFQLRTSANNPPFNLHISYLHLGEHVFEPHKINDIEFLELNYISSVYKQFHVDSGMLYITKFNPDTLIGNFTFHVNNYHESRTINGDFQIYEPDF